ncbi:MULTISPECIES: alkene reductase [unclassified Brevundimonas]|uniref:alkene reductase n=1 Tax=unclassified Brevundimonas TaxID=2622653 RepID=UPI0025BF52B8|nr:MULTISPECIES: alkene reductase [unclassified Brevundimonas]
MPQDTTKDTLFQPLKVGAVTLKNRIVMAPMTRSRADNPEKAATNLTATYYGQRASAGLIITEGTQVSEGGQGYLYTPGIYSEPQTEAWKKVTDAVHAKGGLIAAQLWHVGRISHSSVLPKGLPPVAPSAIRANATTFALDENGTPGQVPTDTPYELSAYRGIPTVVFEFAQAARNAIEAGFDMVELHGANGYLLAQFLSPQTNTRTDQYGGSMENRARFVLEVIDAVAAAIGPDRVGIRLSPWAPQFINDIDGTIEAEEMTLYLAAELEKRGIAYLHMAEWGENIYPDGFRQRLRDTYKGTILYAGGYTQAKAEALLETGTADAVAFGAPFIANPDLAERFREGSEIAVPDKATFYGGGAEGYTDYPDRNGNAV